MLFEFPHRLLRPKEHIQIATRKRQHHPGDAANAFIRVLLSDAGELAGGLDDEEWKETLKFFGSRCAYTGELLTEDSAEQEHAIPINRHHCGLHLYGNVVPATKEANRAKGGRHYRDFVDDATRLQTIEDFMEKVGYQERAKPFLGLQAYCQTQYEVIKALCKANRDYLDMLMPEELRSAHEQETRSIEAETGEDDEARWNPRRGTIGALAKECIGDGFSDEETLKRVRAKSPGKKTGLNSIRWYRSQMRKHDKSIPTNSEFKSPRRPPEEPPPP